VVFANSGILVIDFGLLAYSETSSDVEVGFRTGDFVEGNVTLDVDPFFTLNACQRFRVFRL
jgi:hypothetical protein